MQSYRAASASELELIERRADEVLAEVGIRFQDDPATLEILAGIGAKIGGDVARLDGEVLRRIVRENAPRQFLLRGRNPERDTVIGGTAGPAFAPVYGAPDVLLDDGRHVPGSRAIYNGLVAACHASPALTNTGHMLCVMHDVPVPARHLAMLHAHLTLSDKPFMGTVDSPEACQEFIDLTRAAVARPRETGACDLLHLINCTPPLTYWPNPLKCLRVIARNGEASIVSSYAMMGATSPVTVAGTLIQGYAEVLAGLALVQLWHPGAPVVMGLLGYPFDMRAMLPNFGDPASQWMQFYAAGLAQRLGVPLRADGAIGSAKTDDAQAGYEGAHGLAAAAASGAHFVLHAAGWLQQGRCVSAAKLGRDARAIVSMNPGRGEANSDPLPLDSMLEAEILDRVSRRKTEG